MQTGFETGFSRTGRGRIRAALTDRLEQQRLEREGRLAEIMTERRDREEASLPAEARLLRRLARLGEYDRTESGLIRLRRGPVAGETFVVTVLGEGGHLLLEFASELRRGHGRRLLVTAAGGYFLEVDGGKVIPASPSGNKYAAAAVTILALRAHEADLVRAD